jgi:hypothetical protein
MAAQGNPKLSTCKKVKKLTLILLLLISTTCWGEWTKVAEGTSGTDWYIDCKRSMNDALVHWCLICSSFMVPGSKASMSSTVFAHGSFVNTSRK